MISEETIQQVFDTVRIEEVVGDFVELKRSGQNYKGLSPFTSEKTPSFVVSPSKNIFKCFSSGKAGSAITFLKEVEKMEFPAAIRYLANKYNIKIVETQLTDEQKAKKSHREDLLAINQAILQFYQDTLWTDEEGKAIGYSYFKSRGYSDATIKEFGLGYVKESKESLYHHLQKSGYNVDLAVELGFLVGRNGNIDKYNSRVTFPIYGLTGQTLGLGARVLDTNSEAAKYFNSSDSEIYNKSKILYGLYQCKKTITQQNNVYLVEGYTDVISLYQAGITNVVASSGTSFTQQQAQLINRFAKKITLLFDGDKAGMNAAQKALNISLREGLDVNYIPLPTEHDPDSLSKSMSTDQLLEFLETNSKDFLLSRIQYCHEIKSPAEKSKEINNVIQSIFAIADKIKQELYLEQVRTQLGLSNEAIEASLRELQDERTQSHLRDARREARQSKVPEQSYDSNIRSQIGSDSKEVISKLEQQIVSAVVNAFHEEVHPFAIINSNRDRKPYEITLEREQRQTIKQLFNTYILEEERQLIESEELKYLLTKFTNKSQASGQDLTEDEYFAEIYSKYYNFRTSDQEFDIEKLSFKFAELLISFKIDLLNKIVLNKRESLSSLSDDTRIQEVISETDEILAYRNMLANSLGKVI